MKSLRRIAALLVAASAGVWLASGVLPLGLLASAAAADTSALPVRYLTCDVFGGSFVLDDADFKALASPEARGNNPPLTPQYVVSLKLTSTLRQQICDSRGLYRRIKSGICSKDDFKMNFRLWLPQFFSDEEQKILLDCQINIATE